jgi:glycosyltransferase 2 family protein
VRRRAAWLLGLLWLALAVALVAVARPAAILALIRRSHPEGVLLAFAWAALVLLLRGARLSLVVGGDLPLGRAVGVTGVVGMAVTALPMRAGELALMPMLRTAGIPGTIRGLSLLVSVRVLDVVGLAPWVLVAAVLLGGRYGWAALPLAVVPLLAAAGVAVAMRALRRFAGRWRSSGGLRRRALGQLLQVRRELREVARSPLRGGGSVLLSVAVWGGIWQLTVPLVRAMGLDWSSGAVLVGVLGATVGAALPLNMFGTFGTLEAGWTAALASLGMPPAAAVAAGFATHLWNLLFSVALGGASALALAIAQTGTGASRRRARRSRDRTPPGVE